MREKTGKGEANGQDDHTGSGAKWSKVEHSAVGESHIIELPFCL